MLQIENFPINTIKGKICTQTIIHEFENGDLNIELSIKPKCAMFGLGNLTFKCIFFLECFVIAAMVLTINICCTVSATIVGEKLPTNRKRQNLITLKSHCVLTCLYIL